ncbi:unnamed protein product, partial [Effrenium voratum]
KRQAHSSPPASWGWRMMAITPGDATPKSAKAGAGNKVAYGINKVCFFTISDFVEDRVRVRSLNIVAFSLIYIFFVFALLKTVPTPQPRVKEVTFANPPPSAWLSGAFSTDLKNLYTSTGSLPNRSQKVFVIDDSGSPMQNAAVEVKVTNFVAHGPVSCSKADVEAKAGTAEARRLQHVCRYDQVAENKGPTNPSGLISFSNFTINGPAGVYTVVPSAEGVDSTQEGTMLVSTPVASIEVVDDNLTSLPEVLAPRSAEVGQPLEWQPRILVRDMRGLPVPGRKIIAFANPDPTWPPVFPLPRTPPYDRRGQKVVELNCPESELSDEAGIARFTCLGINSSNVDHVSIVFSESGLVFNPWNDETYSPRNSYPITVSAYRYATYVVSKVDSVKVTTPVPSTVQEGVAFSPPPAVTAKDANGQPLAGVNCYALVSLERGTRNPNWFRRQLRGSKHKELLDAVAVTDSDGVATFSQLRVSVQGNTMDLALSKSWAQTTAFSIGFNCEGVEQETHPWDPQSGTYISHVETTVAGIRIQRFIRKSAEISGYLSKPRDDGSDAFLAVVRVVDAAGNGVPGKTVEVKYAGELDNVHIELQPDAIEVSNDLGFAVVAFQLITGPAAMISTGSLTFSVTFLVDGVSSEPSQQLTGRMIGGLKPQACHLLYPMTAAFYDIATTTVSPLSGWPILASSGNIFFTTFRLKGQTSCTVFPGVSTPNASKCAEGAWDRRLEESDLKTISRRLAGLSESSINMSRRLQSSDGSITVELEPIYSTDKDQWGTARFEPRPFLQTFVIQDPSAFGVRPVPTIREYNDDPNFVEFACLLDGPSGDHWIRLKMTIDEPGAEQQTCFSRMVPLRIENAIGDIALSGDGGPGSLYDEEVEGGTYIDIDLRFLLDASVVNASDLSNIPSCIHIHANYWQVCSIKFTWVEAPFNFHQAMGMTGAGNFAHPLDTDFYSLVPVNKTGTTNDAGFDAVTGTLHLRMHFKQRGLYGNFGIQFHGFGVNSRIFTWRILPPPGLRFEVVQEPAFLYTRALPGNSFDVLPKVRVLSDLGPVNGLVIATELVEEPGARFEKFTNLKMYDAFDFVYSRPSGTSVNTLSGQSQGPAEDGLAMWPLLGIFDGSGCTRMRFIAEGVSSEVVPATPVCFEDPFVFTMVTPPPPSWPLGVPISDLGGLVTIEIRPKYELPQFTQFLGGLVIRLLVSSEGGKDILDVETSIELSQRMLAGSTCLFLNSVEILQRCTPLVPVQIAPFPVLRTSFRQVSWERRISQPAKMVLKATDLSGSGFRSGMPLPDGFHSMTPAQQLGTCAEAAADSKSLAKASLTPEISAEIAPSQYNVVLAPPELVYVGAMFLIRIKVTTASGAPARDVRIRVGIKTVSSTSPSSTSPGLLQSLAASGNSIQVVSDSNVQLDPSTTVRVSDSEGVIGFPLTVERATSGTYQLQFQPDVPDARIVLQTSTFKVENPIIGISSPDSWGQLEITEFGKPFRVNRAPRFCISTATNETLQQLQDAGVRSSLTLTLKGAPAEREGRASQLVMQLRKQAASDAQVSANRILEQFAQNKNGALNSAAKALLKTANSKAVGIFAGFSEEFAEACFETPARQLLAGDPALASNLGSNISAAAEGLIAEQSASLAEALGVDPQALGATQALNQFTDVLMSAGSNLKPPSDVAVKGKWELSLNDLEYKGGCEYEATPDIEFAFAEKVNYVFSLSVNGVEGANLPTFGVVLAPADPVDLAFNWLCSSIAAILGIILLTTNATLHRWQWFFVAFACTLAVTVALPFLTLHHDALYGYWLHAAVANVMLIAAALIYGFSTEVMKHKTGSFDKTRANVFESYTKRKLQAALGWKAEPFAAKQSIFSKIKRAFLQPFDAEDAFFYPTAFLIANLLAFLSFLYVLAQSLTLLRDIEKMLQQVLNTAIQRSVSMTSSVNQAYVQATGSDLPDSSTEFMYVQIDLMRGWFQKLIDSIVIGFASGVVIAAILTTLSLLGGFVHFRASVMDARRGKFDFKLSDAKLVFSTTFIGINISSAIVSYILIVALVTLITIPFTFELTWQVIWNALPTILLTFVLPKILTIISMKIFKKCLYGGTFIKTRAGASIFHFYMTFLSLPGGVASAITRFVMGLLGTIAMLPITYGPVTPSMVNKVMLLDTSYRTYVAFVMLYATHNNPIMITAANRLLMIKSTREKFKEDGRHWTSTHSMLLLILIRFPHLRQYRKSYLEKERKLKEIQKGRKKPSSEDAVKVKVEDISQARVEDPWIANAIDGAHQALAVANQRLELMKRYRVILSGLPEDSAQRAEIMKTIRELAGEIQHADQPPPFEC